MSAPRLTVALSTSSRFGSIAVAVDGHVRHEESIEEGLVHGREIVRRLEIAFDEIGRSPGDIDLVVCDRGPGSFTGMRVGITTAKTLAFAVGAGVVGIATPEAIAWNLPLDAGPRTVLLDAKRNELYVAPFEPEAAGLRAVSDIRLVRIDAIREAIDPGAVLLGDGVALCRDALEGHDARIAPTEANRPMARRVLELGLERASRGLIETPDRLLPLYLRSSEPIVRKPKPRPATAPTLADRRSRRERGAAD